MYKWRIDIILKNGNDIAGHYEGVEDTSVDVANKLFFGKRSTDLISLESATVRAQHIFVIAGEIAVFSITPRR